MKREIYSFVSSLELENYINELRIQHAKNYLVDKIDLRVMTNEDLIAVYTMLQIKDKEKKKKMLDEIVKQ